MDNVDVRLDRGESVGLVGESGSGKTTLGRLMLKLDEPSGGAMLYEGERVGAMQGERLRRFRQQAQLVFQNPFDAVNPRFTIRRAVAEPLINTRVPRAEHEARITESLRLVRLGDPAPGCSTSARRSCPAASCSAWCWPARWWCGPTSWSRTSPSRCWTSAPAPGC